MSFPPLVLMPAFLSKMRGKSHLWHPIGLNRCFPGRPFRHPRHQGRWREHLRTSKRQHVRVAACQRRLAGIATTKAQDVTPSVPHQLSLTAMESCGVTRMITMMPWLLQKQLLDRRCVFRPSTPRNNRIYKHYIDYESAAYRNGLHSVIKSEDCWRSTDLSLKWAYAACSVNCLIYWKMPRMDLAMFFAVI